MVVGAGAIGRAIAGALVVLEKESVAGSGASSRNSEVNHAGLYYEPESLKAILCVRGRRMLSRRGDRFCGSACWDNLREDVFGKSLLRKDMLINKRIERVLVQSELSRFGAA